MNKDVVYWVSSWFDRFAGNNSLTVCKMKEKVQILHEARSKVNWLRREFQNCAQGTNV